MDEILESEVDEFIAKISTEIGEIEAKNLQVDLLLSIFVMLKGTAAENKDKRFGAAGKVLHHSDNPDIVICHLEELAQVIEEDVKTEKENEEDTPTEKSNKKRPSTDKT